VLTIKLFDNGYPVNKEKNLLNYDGTCYEALIRSITVMPRICLANPAIKRSLAEQLVCIFKAGAIDNGLHPLPDCRIFVGGQAMAAGVSVVL
jgi:hypothetical protein